MTCMYILGPTARLTPASSTSVCSMNTVHIKSAQCSAVRQTKATAKMVHHKAPCNGEELQPDSRNSGCPESGHNPRVNSPVRPSVRYESVRPIRSSNRTVAPPSLEVQGHRPFNKTITACTARTQHEEYPHNATALGFRTGTCYTGECFSRMPALGPTH